MGVKETMAKVMTDEQWKGLDYLYARWMDEKEYEDFNEYAKQMKLLVKDTPAIFIKASKRPFGFTILVQGKTIQVFARAKSLGWKEL